MELFEVISQMAKGADEGWGGGYYHVIPKLINDNQFKVGAEIGVAYGGHAESILSKTEIEMLYLVDPYQPDPQGTDGYTLPNGKEFGKEEYEELYLHALHRTRKYKNGFDPRTKFIRDTSHAASTVVDKHLGDGYLDFVFIDAKHTYNDLMADLKLWSPLVRNGGIVSGHDFGHDSYPGIEKCVRDWALGSVINIEDGYVWWIRV